MMNKKEASYVGRQQLMFKTIKLCSFNEFKITCGTSRTRHVRNRMSVFNQRAAETISMHTFLHLLDETEYL
uniref:Uncharacterized protein n=1 Tax=Arion vulgaris TaxID=1028688 RepID=A0A0B6XW39_9EUPU